MYSFDVRYIIISIIINRVYQKYCRGKFCSKQIVNNVLKVIIIEF